MSTGPAACADLERRLEYRFHDKTLLLAAITHASAAGVHPTYERLEFLGDRVLGLVISDFLMRRHPIENEGELARRFSALVDRASLAEIANCLDLGNFLRLSPGEQAAGVGNNESVLGDVMEALVGAIYKDTGLEAAREVVERFWLPLANRAEKPPLDPKTALQELAQSNGGQLPRYKQTAQSGPDHEPIFTVEVEIDGVEPVLGEGSSKRAAERAAATALLGVLSKSK